MCFPSPGRSAKARAERAAASQRTAEPGGAVHAHRSPPEGAHPKGVEGHSGLKMHRKSKSQSEGVESISTSGAAARIGKTTGQIQIFLQYPFLCGQFYFYNEFLAMLYKEEQISLPVW